MSASNAIALMRWFAAAHVAALGACGSEDAPAVRGDATAVRGEATAKPSDDENALASLERYVRTELPGSDFEGLLQGQYRGSFSCRWTIFDLQRDSVRSPARGIATGELTYLGRGPYGMRAAFLQKADTWVCEAAADRAMPGKFETWIGFAAQPRNACEIIRFACSGGKHGNEPPSK